MSDVAIRIKGRLLQEEIVGLCYGLNDYSLACKYDFINRHSCFPSGGGNKEEFMRILTFFSDALKMWTRMKSMSLALMCVQFGSA